jgi:hypothetical protein
MPFDPSTPIEQTIYEGRYDDLMENLRVMRPDQRSAQRNRVLHVLKLMDAASWAKPEEQSNKWGMPPTRTQRRAAGAAIFVCGTPEDAAKHYDNTDDLVVIAKEFQPKALDGLAEAILAVSLFRIFDVQRLISAGVVSRPASDNYATALIELPRRLRTQDSFEDYLKADPGLKDVLLRIMDVEGTPETNLASADKYHKGQTWSQILRSMCEQGLYSRALLLDKTLSSLERDWLQFRSGWFSRFHGELEPRVEEMLPHRRRYLALCHSRIPPTVTFALTCVQTLDDDSPFEATDLLDALRPVLSSAVKAQVVGALKFLDRISVREPGAKAQLASAASISLSHESPEVQKQVLVRLEKWGVSNDLRVTLGDFVSGVAAVHRKTLGLLIGNSVTETTISLKPTETRSFSKVAPLDSDRRLFAINDIDELVEGIAYVFEHDTDVDEFERTLAALVRFAPLSADARKRFEPILKRAAKVKKPVAFELGRMLRFLLDGVQLPSEPSVSERDGRTGLAERYLIERVNHMMSIAAQAKGLTPLSTPTHKRGFIDPIALVERIREHQIAGLKSPILEEVQSLLRLPGGGSESALTQARTLAETPYVLALRYALGDEVTPKGNVELFAAAARIRHPNADDELLRKQKGADGPDGAHCTRYQWRVSVHKSEHSTWRRLHVSSGTAPVNLPFNHLAIARHPPVDASDEPWYQRWRFAGADPGVIFYSSTILPSSLEAFFAEGADMIGNNLDWSEAQWESSAYLTPLLDATVPLTPMATLLLALTLAAKEPGQNALAVDALVRFWRESDFDVGLLGGAMCDLLRESIVMPTRYAKSLRSALRIEPHFAGDLFELLCIMLEANSSEPLKGATLLLELLEETMLSASRTLSETARLAVSSLHMGGKGAAIKRSVLSRER